MIGGLAVLGFFLWTWLRPPEAAPGAFLKSEPQQKFTLAIPIRRGEFTIYPVATFQVDARVLGRKLYEGDMEARVAPVDLALGWGPLADEAVARTISVSQEGRFYHWRAETLPLPASEISRSSANMHIIPGSADVEKFVSTVEPGQHISLKGWLVAVRGPDRWGWSSSLTRNDTGEGACEVFYVNRAAVIRDGGEVPPTATAIVKALPAPRSTPTAPGQHPSRTVILKKSKTFPIPHGNITVPAGETLRITEEKGSKVKAAYRGLGFWVERKELE